MKTLSIFTFFLLCVVVLQAQTIEYEYDSNGNRVFRHVIAISQQIQSQAAQEPQRPLGEENNGQQKIAIYPNPTRGLFSIGITGLETNKQNFYLLYDISGRLIKRSNITSDRTSVDVTWNASGIYLLDISLGGRISRWKIVKQ